MAPPPRDPPPDDDALPPTRAEGRGLGRGPAPAARPPRESDAETADAADLRPPPAAGEAGRSPAALPRRIGRYRILGVIGEGGMGTVYRAEQTEPIRRQVAVKVIHASRLGTHAAHRFEAERQALARMTHAAIAQVHEAGDTEGGHPFFAMELVPGEPITEYCDHERLTVDRRLELFVEICRGIHHAHQKGILHRDVKPANVLVATEQGRPVPKIIDFGIAKAIDQPAEAQLTAFGAVLGTPSYLSPEAVVGTEGADPDTRSDVYSLGILLCELLVGVRPFGRPGETITQILHQVAEGEAPAPSSLWRSLPRAERDGIAARRRTTAAGLARRLRGDLDWIARKATARERDRRYDSAAELADDVERHLRLEPVSAGPPSPLYALGKLARRYRAAVLGAALVVLALVAGIVARSIEATRANREAAAARRAQAEAQQVVDFLVDLFEVSDPGSARGETITARELLDRGAEEIRGRLGDQPLVRARLLDTIGLVYRRLDLPEPARPLLEEALAERERLLGPDHPEVATTLEHLGEVYWIGGEYETAERALERALAIRERVYGGDHLLVAETLDDLGSVHEIQAEFDAAEPHLRRALAIREKQLPPDDLRIAASLDDLGVFHLDQGEGEAAEPLFRRALAIREAELGPDHPDVAISANGLAGALSLQDRDRESAEVHARALAIREKVFGPESSPVAQTLNNVAHVYQELGREADAERALVRAAAIWEEILGSDHPRLGIVLFNLADLYLGRGEPGRAEPLFRRSAAVLEAGLGPEHPRLAYPLKGLADALRAQGEREESGRLCRRAVAIREAALGPDDPQTRSTREECAGGAAGEA